ncbi:MAG: DegV family protein [Anaerolineae bacterium]|nr:DegV family protein [Anaerolineae bacterium]MDH7473630.1 DegV family protein [Anaerolineae bacterium]
MIKVVTDSTSDLPPEMASELGITIVPCNVHFGTETYRDGVDLTRQQFYEKLATSKELPTTSAPGVGIFAEAYRRQLEIAEGVVAIHVASALSVVYNAARLGAEKLDQTRIAVLDSKTVSMGLGWLAVIAARAAREGLNLSQVVERVQAAIPRTRLVAAINTMTYLWHSGRVNWGAAVLGTLLDIKPIVDVREGIVRAVARVRTRKKALVHLRELLEGMGPVQEVAVLHTQEPQLAEQFADEIADLFPRKRMVIVEAGTIIGTHVGPGGIGVACVLAGG